MASALPSIASAARSRILQSVHAADAGTVINPMQLQGQVEGAISWGISWALYERIVIDETGKIVNPQFRNYRIPAYADIPRSEVYFADTCDPTRPARRQRDGRVPDQPGRPGAGQRAGGRHRRPLPRSALPPRSHLPADLRKARNGRRFLMGLLRTQEGPALLGPSWRFFRPQLAATLHPLGSSSETAAPLAVPERSTLLRR